MNLARPADVAILVLACNRPALLEQTLRSLAVSLGRLDEILGEANQIPLTISIDGPSGDLRGDRAHQQVRRVASEAGIASTIISQVRPRGLPAHLLEAYEFAYQTNGARRLIAVEDDVELSPWAVSALLYASARVDDDRHVISGSPRHADGSLEHQLLLVSEKAHRASETYLREYIERFSLDGARHPGGYGNRDHGAIDAWTRSVDAQATGAVAKGTSQDRIRERAWIHAGLRVTGLPSRMMRHRGMWGQHNTPWFALKTGQLFQRVDARAWDEIAIEIDRAYRA